MSYRVKSLGRPVLLRDCPETATNAEKRAAPMYEVGDKWVTFEHAPLPDAWLQIEPGEGERGKQYVRENTIVHGSKVAEPPEEEEPGSFLEGVVGRIEDKAKSEDETVAAPKRRRGRPRKTKPEEGE